MAEGEAMPSTPMEFVRRLTEQLVTPGTFFTAFFYRAEQAAQLMPVTLYCSIADSFPSDGCPERGHFMSRAAAAAVRPASASRFSQIVGHAGVDVLAQQLFLKSRSVQRSPQPPAPEYRRSRRPCPASCGCRAPGPRCGSAGWQGRGTPQGTVPVAAAGGSSVLFGRLSGAAGLFSASVIADDSFPGDSVKRRCTLWGKSPDILILPLGGICFKWA